MNDSNTNASSQTNWAKVDAQADDDIDTSEIPPLPESWFERAQVRRPDGMLEVRVQVDPAVFAWFAKHGSDSGRMATAALTSYAAAHQPSP